MNAHDVVREVGGLLVERAANAVTAKEPAAWPGHLLGHQEDWAASALCKYFDLLGFTTKEQHLTRMAIDWPGITSAGVFMPASLAVLPCLTSKSLVRSVAM